MGRMYQKPLASGREYVDAAVEFCSRTTFYCLKLPKRWDAVLLRPLIKTAQDIEIIATMANKIYINPATMDADALLKAYGERIDALQRTIRLFASFDVAFTRLMSFLDVQSTERSRLKKIISNIIKEEKKNDPALQTIEIKLEPRIEDITFVSTYGRQRLRLSLTPKNRDTWLGAEETAVKWIKKRLQADRAEVEKLTGTQPAPAPEA